MRSECGWSLAVGWAALAAACAPSLSTFQPAHVAPKGHWQVDVGGEIFLAPGAAETLIDTAKTVAEKSKTQMLTDDEKWQIYDAGINVAISPPLTLPSSRLSVAYTPVDRLEVSFRYAGSAPRFGVRYQLIKQEDAGVDLTVGVGGSRFSYAVPLGDVLPVLKIDDFVRWSVDLPILVGKHGDWYRLWAGPKVLLTTFDTSLTLDLVVEQDEVARFDGKAAYLGAQAGAAVGWKYVFVGFELTVARVIGTAHATVLGRPVRDTDLGATVVYPSFGLMGEF